MQSSPWLLGALGAALFALVVQTARLRWREGRAGRRSRRVHRRAARGERDAERMLERAGFRVVDRQVRRKVRYEVDGKALEVGVKADLLVRRGAERLVAEVKTGDSAPKPGSVATRRQLLEYGRAFGVDAILLVDATRGTIVEVGLPRAPAPDRPAPWGWLVGASLALAGAWLAWLEYIS